MAELIDDVLELLAPWPTANALAMTLRFESANEASTSAQLAVPLLVSGMVARLKDPAKARGLIDLIAAVDVSGLSDLEGVFNGRRFEPTGSDTVANVLGDRHEKAAEAIAEEVGCDEASAHGVFPPMAWLIIEIIANRHGTAHNRHTLLNVVQREEAALLKAGWGEWMSVVDPEADDGTDGRAGVAPTTPPAGAGSYPPPVSRATRSAVADPAPPEKPTARAETSSAKDPDRDRDRNRDRDRAAATRQTISSPSASKAAPSAAIRTEYGDVANDVDAARVSSSPQSNGRRAGTMILGLLVGAVLVLGAYWLINRDSSTDGTEDDSTQSADSGDDGEDAVDGDGTAGDPDAGDGNGSTDGSAAGESFAVALADRTGDSPGVEGTAMLRLDVDGGQLCYEIEASGFDGGLGGQVSQGEDGVQGRMVVDLGQLAQPASGCVSADPAALEAARDDPAGHYLVLYSPDRTVTITGTLSGGTTSESQTTLAYDPDGGGAFIIIDGDLLILEGNVADAATEAQLLAEFEGAGFDVSTIDNRLQVVEGAPNPSGRIVIQDDVLFGVGSAELAEQESVSLAQAAQIFIARPDWQIQILGHTDNTGSAISNLALSQDRADAVLDALVELGVSSFALEASGRGDTEPAGDNNTPEGREQNRRIEFRIQSGSG